MLAAINRRLRRLQKDDAGFTLIELLMAITVGSVIIAAGFAATTAAMRLQNKTTNRVDALNRGRNAMEAITSAVRSQQCAGGVRPMLWASDYGMEFYASGSAFNTSPTTPLQPIQRIRIEWLQNPTGTRTDITNNANPVGDIYETVETETTPGAVPLAFGRPVTRIIAEDVEKTVDRSFRILPSTPATAIPYVPMFQYYQYKNAVGDGRVDYTNPVDMVASARDAYNTAGVASALSTDLAGIVLVQVNFRITPRQTQSDGSSGATALTGGVNLYNTISVRIADPTNPAGSPQCL